MTRQRIPPGDVRRAQAWERDRAERLADHARDLRGQAERTDTDTAAALRRRAYDLDDQARDWQAEAADTPQPEGDPAE